MDFVNELPHYGGAIIDIIKNPPRWDPSRVKKFPIQYVGNYTFAQMKNLNTILRNTSALITIASGLTTAPVTVPITVVTAKVDIVLDIIDALLPALKEVSGYNLDRNRAMEVYNITGTIVYFFIPTDQYYPGYTNDIRDYVTLTPNNRWRYIDLNKKTEISENVLNFNEGDKINRNVKDMKAIYRTGGTAILTAYNGSTLYIYGIGAPVQGVFSYLSYNPPVVVGDDRLSIGKSYRTAFTTTVVSGTLQGTTQQAQQIFEVQARETVQVHTGIYTDCWKIRETIVLGDQTQTQTHWMVKDIGTIRTLTPDNTDYQLYRAIVNGRKYGSG